MSKGIDAKMIPVIPPIVKVITVPEAKIIGVFITTDPPVIVASQLKILIPVGTAASIVVSITINLNKGSAPVVDMWCPYTTNEIIPIVAMA